MRGLESHQRRGWPLPVLLRATLPAAIALADSFRRARVEEVIAWLRSEMPFITGLPDRAMINVKNGLLDWRSMELMPHSHEVYSTIQLPVLWNPEASCPAIDR